MNGNRRITGGAIKQEQGKGINLQIAEAKSAIVDAINKTNMPPSIMLMMLEEITTQVRAQNAYMVDAERKALEEGGEQNAD